MWLIYGWINKVIGFYDMVLNQDNFHGLSVNLFARPTYLHICEDKLWRSFLSSFLGLISFSISLPGPPYAFTILICIKFIQDVVSSKIMTTRFKGKVGAWHKRCNNWEDICLWNLWIFANMKYITSTTLIVQCILHSISMAMIV